jgi:hypothetical protein
MNAFAAASAYPELPGEVAHAGGSAIDGAADVPVRDSFTDANDHGGYLNANANDCQYLACVTPKQRLKQRLSMRARPMHNACCPLVAVR